MFEYKIFNLSEVNGTKKDFITLLNQYGSQGWEVVFRLTDTSFLMKKKLS